MSVTTTQLRTKLFTMLNDINSGKVTLSEARAINEIAKQINSSIRYDIENKRENIKLMKATSAEKYREMGAKPLKLY